jgi:hypothetical protein
VCEVGDMAILFTIDCYEAVLCICIGGCQTVLLCTTSMLLSNDLVLVLCCFFDLYE